MGSIPVLVELLLVELVSRYSSGSSTSFENYYSNPVELEKMGYSSSVPLDYLEHNTESCPSSLLPPPTAHPPHTGRFTVYPPTSQVNESVIATSSNEVLLY